MCWREPGSAVAVGYLPGALRDKPGGWQRGRAPVQAHQVLQVGELAGRQVCWRFGRQVGQSERRPTYWVVDKLAGRWVIWKNGQQVGQSDQGVH